MRWMGETEGARHRLSANHIHAVNDWDKLRLSVEIALQSQLVAIYITAYLYDLERLAGVLEEIWKPDWGSVEEFK